LISQAVAEGNLDQALSGGGRALAEDDLGALFGIDLDNAGSPPAEPAVADPPVRRKRVVSERPVSKTKTAGSKKATIRAKTATEVEKKAAPPKKSAAKAASSRTPKKRK
jgi:hypothetical protein